MTDTADGTHTTGDQGPSPVAHTPGPWHLVLGTDGSFEIWSEPYDGNPRAFVICARNPIEHRAHASAANGRLLAAAADLVAAVQAQHRAIDILMPMLIESTRGVPMKPFMPSESAIWPIVLQGNAALQKALGDRSEAQPPHANP